jgi:hypothetical protein
MTTPHTPAVLTGPPSLSLPPFLFFPPPCPTPPPPTPTAAFENVAPLQAVSDLGARLPDALAPVVDAVRGAAAQLPTLAAAGTRAGDSERLSELQAVSQGRRGGGVSLCLGGEGVRKQQQQQQQQKGLVR